MGITDFDIEAAIRDYIISCKNNNISQDDYETMLLEILSKAGIEFSR